jgi:hypothetical protein
MAAMQNKINQLEEALKNKNNWCNVNRGSILGGGDATPRLFSSYA